MKLLVSDFALKRNRFDYRGPNSKELDTLSTGVNIQKRREEKQAEERISNEQKAVGSKQPRRTTYSAIPGLINC